MLFHIVLGYPETLNGHFVGPPAPDQSRILAVADLLAQRDVSSGEKDENRSQQSDIESAQEEWLGWRRALPRRMKRMSCPSI